MVVRTWNQLHFLSSPSVLAFIGLKRNNRMSFRILVVHVYIGGLFFNISFCKRTYLKKNSFLFLKPNYMAK